MGARAYSVIEKYKDDVMNGVVVEVGSERNEGSTTFLNNFCKKNDIKFYTIDFDKKQYQKSDKITNGSAYNMTGEHFFEHIFPPYNEKISFAYLDNFDLITHDGRNWEQRKGLYKKHGLQMSIHNNEAKISHLKQAMYVDEFAADKCYILIDDTWIDKETNIITGKGAYAASYLIESNFKLLHQIPVEDEIDGLKKGYALFCRIIS
ncbi:MAG: hypothetical protein ACXAAH_02770 [Promethearchaeota archaeon]|jgi:hypothetical protein